ncbi:retrovirus-related pol polyprotein from transposon TNT 1-94 [Tanacetum coccineum]|uniref:Retrovirus-related pol polyprotein from transposon TNT 1-94 n=1 Tax=Tanacetum coccineum TaxID=301880 RepID=A0ABQ4XJD7_9ASTR
MHVTFSGDTAVFLTEKLFRGVEYGGAVCQVNNQIARIMGYGDSQLGNVIISRKNACFIRNLKGVDLLSGSRDTNLYTISLDDMLKSSLICLLSKASKTKSWLWHRRLSHLNFGTLKKLAKDGLARGIPRLKF